MINKITTMINRLIQEKDKYPILKDVILLLLEIKKELSTDNNEFWEEFKKLYPSMTPEGRRLYNNLDNTKKKYVKNIKNNRKLHEKVLTLLKKELNDRNVRNKLEYLPQISKYVHQKLWEAYDIEETDEIRKFEIL